MPDDHKNVYCVLYCEDRGFRHVPLLSKLANTLKQRWKGMKRENIDIGEERGKNIMASGVWLTTYRRFL